MPISQFFPPAANSAALVQERRKSRKARTQVQAGHHLALRLRAAYLTMHRRANAEFARFGLTADQFVLLTALAERDEVMQKELARRTASDANTMSEMLGRLEQRGLIARERDAHDGRARVLLGIPGNHDWYDGLDGFGCELPNSALMVRIKLAFDPAGKLAPGRLPL